MHHAGTVWKTETCCRRLAEKYRTQKIAKNLPSAHHRTTLSGYIFATKARRPINNQKKVVKQHYLLHMSPQYGEHRPTSAWDLLAGFEYPAANFNGFRILAALLPWLLHGSLVVGVSQTLRRWTEGVTYIRQGGHDGHRVTFGTGQHSGFNFIFK